MLYRLDISTFYFYEPLLVQISQGHRGGTLVENELQFPFLGLTSILSSAESMWCMQHLEKKDIEKLKEYCPCDADRKYVMADIYGTQNSLLLESGLADAENEEDFIVKLACLQAVWDNIAPGFHHLFKKWMSDIFIDCLILNSRGRHGISKLLTTNGLKLKHWLQEKVLTEDEVPKQIVSVSQLLKKWTETCFKAVRKAVRVIRKYRLSPEFSSFYVDPAIWVQWSEEWRNQYYKAFLQSA